MTRGYLSLRVNEANPAHHLYVNTGGRADGKYWVAYTLHFGGRKRRVRRSLGTKCLAEAIRLRDELFARIERDGEAVPDRRRTNQADGQSFIVTADSTFTECERLTATPIDTSDQAKRHWRRAAKLYGIAAEYYRWSGLGLRAISALRGASKCYEALGMTKEQEAYRLKSVSIPVYYGDASCE